MKALTLWQPYASLIAIGDKKIETRSWHTKYRGPLAIHAAKAYRNQEKNLILCQPYSGALKSLCFLESTLERDRGKNVFAFLPENLPTGAVIATCKLVDCLWIGNTHLREYYNGQKHGIKMPLPAGNELAFGDYAPGRFAWILEDIKPLPKPIPAKGKQGLWNWEVSE